MIYRGSTGDVVASFQVLMRRAKGTEDFPSKLWADFKQGFGNLTTDFWLGKSIIHRNVAFLVWEIESKIKFLFNTCIFNSSRITMNSMSHLRISPWVLTGKQHNVCVLLNNIDLIFQKCKYIYISIYMYVSMHVVLGGKGGGDTPGTPLRHGHKESYTDLNLRNSTSE